MTEEKEEPWFLPYKALVQNLRSGAKEVLEIIDDGYRENNRFFILTDGFRIEYPCSHYIFGVQQRQLNPKRRPTPIPVDRQPIDFMTKRSGIVKYSPWPFLFWCFAALFFVIFSIYWFANLMGWK